MAIGAKRGPRRPQMERECDYERIAHLYLQRKTQAEIGETVGISQQQVSYDLKAIRRRWAESANEAIGKRMAEEIARIDRLEREHWRAWDMKGDPRYLEGVMSCIQKRMETLRVCVIEQESTILTDPGHRIEGVGPYHHGDGGVTGKGPPEMPPEER